MEELPKQRALDNAPIPDYLRDAVVHVEKTKSGDLYEEDPVDRDVHCDSASDSLEACEDIFI